MRLYIVEVDVLVAPFEVVDDTFVSQFLFHYENVLKEIYYSFFDIKVIELCNHGLLVLQVLLVRIHQGISLVNH